MLNLTGIAAVTSSCMLAAPLGTHDKGRLAEVGVAEFASGTHTPAFLKDITPGVRAWSPPV